MLLVFLLGAHASASVTMLGTRVIYPADAGEQALRFSNPDDHPNLVQLWLDDGHAGRPDGQASPFLVIPPVFRIEPRGGQVVRLSYAGAPLPQDRESLFFLNFLQVPALKADSGQRQPTGADRAQPNESLLSSPALAGETDAARAPEALSFAIDSSDGTPGMVVRNGSGYHLMVQQADLVLGARRRRWPGRR
jgi:fimbrial chaperone protein